MCATHSSYKRKPPFRFLILLMSLLGLHLIPSFFPLSALTHLLSVLLTCVLLASLYLVVYNLREWFLGMSIAAPALVLNWWSGIFIHSTQTMIVNVLFMLLVIYTIRYLLRYVLQVGHAALDTIYTCLCVYLLLGLLWTFFYASIESVVPGSFSFASELSEFSGVEKNRILFSQLNYFSFVTLSTLGYGDITPMTRLARSVASTEAIIGQLYLAVVVARLVGMYSNASFKSDSVK